MTVRWSAIWILGAGQCVYWGVLYYTFSVLLVPMRAELQASDGVIAGAFSVGLGVSALLATVVGRWLDRGHGPMLMRWGAVSAAALLWTWSTVQTTQALYAVWIGLGACMALVLYEAAFAIVIRAVAESNYRLRALASVTVMGGLASTIFLPLVGAGVTHIGWRATLRVLVVIWLAVAWMLERRAFPAFRESAASLAIPKTSTSPIDTRLVLLVGAPFVTATFAAMAVTTLVIPTLVDRGHSIEAAAWVLAALGIMQLPGRLWLWRRGAGRISTRSLLLGPLLLQATGLLLLAAANTLFVAFSGVAIFGIGAGLHTLARPWVVPLLFGVASAAQVNGMIARGQGVARAASPFVVAMAYGWFGSRWVFGFLALGLLTLFPFATRIAKEVRRAELPQSAS